jgi:ABC-2 type transport system permease protein
VSGVRFYFVFYRTALKSIAEYRVDFAVGIVTALAMQLAALAFYLVVFSRAPSLGDWSPADMLFLFGLTALVLGVSEVTFNGIWWLPHYVLDGQLDRLLVYPVDSLTFVLMSRPELHAIGNLAAGTATLALAWSRVGAPLHLLLFVPLWVVSGAVVYSGTLVIVASLAMRAIGPTSTHLFAVHQLLNSSRYPMSIYPRALRGLLSFVVPFGAVVFVPADYLRGHGSLASALLLPPLAALAIGSVARLAWRGALRGYQSTGS